AEREAAEAAEAAAPAQAEREAAEAAARAQAEREAAEAAARAQAEREAAEAAARAQAEREAAEAAARAQAEREAAEAAARAQAEREAAEAAARAQAEREAAEAAARAQAEREAAEAAAAAALAAPRTPLSPQDTIVMVVDDSKVVRVKTNRLLIPQGYKVVLAESAEQAIEFIAAEPPHVLITDVEMPGMDGFDLTRHVRATPAIADLPVIMITSADDRKAAADAAGVTLLLGKPYPEERLIECIERARQGQPIV
ncbi:response regulator, partial [Inhella sp.]|uniref:response regulator n=1 Tax=Inhella sp. TaxID=1921806 RepID=UPI0035B252EB